MFSEITNISRKKDFVTKERYLEIINPILELAISRNKKYGNSVAEMDDTSIIDLVKMKISRVKNMIYDSEENPDEKIYDEIFDSINFLVMICMRMKDRGEQLEATNGSHN